VSATEGPQVLLFMSPTVGEEPLVIDLEPRSLRAPDSPQPSIFALVARALDDLLPHRHGNVAGSL